MATYTSEQDFLQKSAVKYGLTPDIVDKIIKYFFSNVEKILIAENNIQDNTKEFRIKLDFLGSFYKTKLRKK